MPELIFKIGANDAALKSVLADVRNQYGRTITEITNQTKQEAAAAASLQRQRSAALIAQWKADTRAHEKEEKERSRAAQSLQKQRSSALIAIWKAEERERVRLAQQAQREIERAEAQSQQRRQAFIGGAVGGLTALLGVSAVSEIRAAGAAMLDYASTLETTRIAFTTMLGSATLAEQHLKELQAFALKTPFQFEELIAASQRMQALGFSATQVIPILNDVGNAVAAAGGGSERLDRVILAISQIQSKGRVATQELNQLAESGISGFKILEQATGKTGDALRKMVEQGEISSKVFLDAFQKFSQQNFGGLMEAQSKTFSGAMSNIKDALLQTSAVAFAPLYERLSKLANSFSEASQKSDEFKGKMEAVGQVVLTVADGIIEFIHIVKDAYSLVMTALVAQLDVATAAFSGLVRSVHAAVYALLALSKAARGDFIGAFVAMERAQQLSEIAVNDLTHAANAQIAVVREMGRIWEEAAARTRRAANEIAFANAIIGVGKTTGAQNVGGGSAGDAVATNAPVSSGGSGGSGRSAARSAAAKAAADAIREAQAQEDVNNRLVDLYNKLQDELAGVATNTHKWAIEQEILNGKLKDASPELQKEARETARLTDASEKQLKLQNQLLDFLTKQEAAVDEAINGAKTQVDVTFEFIAALEKEGAVLQEKTKTLLIFNAALLQNAENRRRIAEVIESAPTTGPGGDIPGVGEDDGSVGRRIEEQIGPPPLPDITEASQAQVAALDVMREAFAGLADAASSAVDAFIKFGNAGTSFRKFVAEILSGIARMAITKAIFELAEGFAALAMSFFGIPNAGPSAAAHFTAAAMYGAIAGVAAVAGRVTAGNAYSKDAGTASGAFNSSTGGGRGGSGSSSAPKTTEVDRRSYNAQPIVRELRLTVNGDAVIDRFVEDFDLNGRTRIIVSSGG